MQDKKRVLITGINGLIGSTLRSALDDHYIVSGVDKAGEVDNSSTFIADIANITELQEVFKKLSPIDYVIHLAANPYPDAPWEDIFRDNFESTRNIYECAREFKVKRVIFAGSTHMFGGYAGYPHTSPLGRKITANDPALSDSDYGDSKAYGEVLARRYFDQHGTETITIRVGHVTTDNKPEAPYEPLWLSYRDLSQVFHKALVTKTPFGAYFAMSGHKDLMFDMSQTIHDLDYQPRDSRE